MKIDIIGPYPPPYGGISLHISRMLPILTSHGYDPKVWNQYKLESADKKIESTKKSILWWALYLFKKKPPIVHFHQFSILHFPYVFLFSWLCKSSVFLTIHNENLLKSSALKRLTCIYFLKMARQVTILSVSSAVQSLMLEHGIKDSVYLPAYVPPSNNIRKKLPGDSKKKIVFNAWRIKNSIDISRYGVDLLVKLAERNPTIAFFFFVGDTSCSFIKDHINSAKVKNISIIPGESLVDYLADADLFLRLNRDDAYGVSIQEALDLSVPAIASNVCKRPQGCILYDRDSFIDLENKFIYAISSKRDDLIREKTATTYHTELIELYKNRTQHS